MCFSRGHDGGLQKPALDSSRGIGPGWPTLGADTAERLRVMRKVTPRATRYQGQHISCDWVIEAKHFKTS